MNVNMRHGRNDDDRGNPKYWGRNLTQCHSVHHKSHKDCPSAPKFPSPLQPTVTQFIPSQTTALLTYLLTLWNRVLLEKLTGFQLVKKFPAFHRTRRFITAFTSARHLSLSWVSSIQSIPPHPPFWRFILILSKPQPTVQQPVLITPSNPATVSQVTYTVYLNLRKQKLPFRQKKWAKYTKRR